MSHEVEDGLKTMSVIKCVEGKFNKCKGNDWHVGRYPGSGSDCVVSMPALDLNAKEKAEGWMS